MPLEVVLLSRVALSIDEHRELGEAANPPMVIAEEHGGAVITYRELDDTTARTVARPSRLDTLEDVARVLGPDVTVPDDSRFWVAGVVPFEYHRGMAMLYALESAYGGTAIVKGMQP